MIDVDWLKKKLPELTDLQPLGRGGQKEVFSATHAEHGSVVLKIFHVGTDQERALREVRASLEMAGTRIPKTFLVDVMDTPVGKVLWLCEERIEGTNLRQILEQRVLTDEEVLRLAEDVVTILAAAETRSIVHRDVKPENIILADDGRFWLIDFGLARHLGLTSLTATTAPFGVGTPGYAPPEQFRNRKDEIDGRADLFGLGVTIYEACEGTNPFWEGARDGSEALRRTETDPVPRLARDIRGIDEFGELVLAMTRARRMHRPESVAYVKDWLDEMLAPQGD